MATAPVIREWDASGKPVQASTASPSVQEWDASGKPIQAAPASPSQPGMLEPHHDWTDPLRGAAAGLKQLVTHPVDSIFGMPNLGGMPGVAFGKAGEQAMQAQSQAVQENAQTVHQMAQDTAAAAKDHPAFLAGQFVGPALLTHGIAKLVPKIPGAIGKVALLGKTPEAAYESAMKPSTTLSQSERAAVVQTGLENEIPVSKGGVEKIGNLINDLNDKIKTTIDADPTRPIDPNAAATRIAPTKGRFANQVNAQGDLNAIEASKDQFLDEQGRTAAVPSRSTGILDTQGKPIMTGGTPAQPAPPMNAADAQTMKQGTYRVLKGKFGEQGSASVEAQKALARGLKEEIATAFPEINNLNAAESRLLDLSPVLERAVNRISNHQLVGIGTPVAGAAAKAVTGSGSVGAVASVMKAVLDNPNVKSRLAIMVSKSQKIPISTAMNRVNAYSASLASTAAASQANSSGDNSDPATTQ